MQIKSSLKTSFCLLGFVLFLIFSASACSPFTASGATTATGTNGAAIANGAARASGAAIANGAARASGAAPVTRKGGESINNQPESLQQILGNNYNAAENDRLNKLGLRQQFIRDAALSFGARKALAYRTWQIQQIIQKYAADNFDKIYRFDALLIPNDGNFLLLPPVVIQVGDAFSLQHDGRKAVRSDQVIKVVRPEQVISVAPHWRDYLVSDWTYQTAPPPASLHPKNKIERTIWENGITEGWAHGLRQAENMHIEAMARLKQDFTGMVNYKILHALGQIKGPYTDTDTINIAGNETKIRINEQTFTITKNAFLVLNPDEWSPPPTGLAPLAGAAPLAVAAPPVVAAPPLGLDPPKGAARASGSALPSGEIIQ